VDEMQPVIDRHLAVAADHSGFHVGEIALLLFPSELDLFVSRGAHAPAVSDEKLLGQSIDELALLDRAETCPVPAQSLAGQLREIEARVNQLQRLVRQSVSAQFRHRRVDQYGYELVHGRAELRRGFAGVAESRR